MTSRRRDEPPIYEVGDSVYLNTKNSTPLALRNHSTTNMSDRTKSLRSSRLTYRLKLPDCVKIADSFHVSLLRLAASPSNTTPLPLPGQVTAPPPPIEITTADGAHQEWEVEEIVDHHLHKQAGRVLKGRARRQWMEFRVLWRKKNDLTWETSDASASSRAAQSS